MTKTSIGLYILKLYNNSKHERSEEKEKEITQVFLFIPILKGYCLIYKITQHNSYHISIILIQQVPSTQVICQAHKSFA